MKTSIATTTVSPITEITSGPVVTSLKTEPRSNTHTIFSSKHATKTMQPKTTRFHNELTSTNADTVLQQSPKTTYKPTRIVTSTLTQPGTEEADDSTKAVTRTSKFVDLITTEVGATKRKTVAVTPNFRESTHPETDHTEAILSHKLTKHATIPQTDSSVVNTTLLNTIALITEQNTSGTLNTMSTDNQMVSTNLKNTPLATVAVKKSTETVAMIGAPTSSSSTADITFYNVSMKIKSTPSNKQNGYSSTGGSTEPSNKYKHSSLQSSTEVKTTEGHKTKVHTSASESKTGPNLTETTELELTSTSMNEEKQSSVHGSTNEWKTIKEDHNLEDITSTAVSKPSISLNSKPATEDIDWLSSIFQMRTSAQSTAARINEVQLTGSAQLTTITTIPKTTDVSGSQIQSSATDVKSTDASGSVTDSSSSIALTSKAMMDIDVNLDEPIATTENINEPVVLFTKETSHERSLGNINEYASSDETMDESMVGDGDLNVHAIPESITYQSTDVDENVAEPAVTKEGLSVGGDGGNSFPEVPEFNNLVQTAKNVSYDAQSIFDLLDLEEMNPISQLAAIKESMPYVFSNITENELMDWGIQKEQFFLKCIYDRVQCDLGFDISTFNDPTLGNCFTFNHANQTVHQVVRAGEPYGFNVQFKVGQDDYLGVTESAGIKLILHRPNSPIFPDGEGYQLPVGYKVSAALATTSIQRRNSKHTKCITNDDKNNFPTPYYDKSGEYTTEACLRSCFHHQVLVNCNCSDPKPPLQPNKCGLEQRNCVNSVYNSFNDSECNCPLPCSETMFDVTASKSKIREGSGKDTIEAFIYFKELGGLSFVEEEGIPFVKLVSNVGSVLGVLLGVSFISVFELLVLLVRLIIQKSLCFIKKHLDIPH